MRKKKKDEPDERGPTSLFLFTPTSPVRKMMTWLVNWPPFDWVIIITIMANCVVMAMDDKLSNNDKSIMSIKLVSSSRCDILPSSCVKPTLTNIAFHVYSWKLSTNAL